MSNTMQTSVRDQMPNREAIETAIEENRGWFTALGVLLLLTGIAAIIFPLAGALAIDFVIATAFIATGVVYLVNAFATGSWGGCAWQIILGLIYIAAGMFLYIRPVEGTVILAAVIAMSLVADGIVRIALSMAMQRGPWGWVMASGILSIVLGMAVFVMSSGTAVLLLGVLVGINLVASGITFSMLAMWPHNEPPSEQAA